MGCVFFLKQFIKMVRVTVRDQVRRGGKAANAYRNMKRRGRPYMKKTTAKGAYNKNRKKNMMIRRAPFVETKVKNREDLVSQFPGLSDKINFKIYNTQHVHMNPETFTMWKRGMEFNECLGNSVYAKYLKMKIGVRFPQPGFSAGGYTQEIPKFPQNYELIWGWVPNELGWTGSTTPLADQASIEDINSFINLRVVDYLNDQKDRMHFIPKRASTIRITGRRKVRPDMRHTSTAPPQTTDNVGEDTVVGTIPDYYTSISWKMNKKLHLQPSSKFHNGDQVGLYPNFGTWLPFCVFVCWDLDLYLPGAARQKYIPSIQYNDQIYYSDS